ncbi:CARDB domain-containing protein [Rhodobacter capsulatus]|uniref:CARDB domain-containing protein n=1 Tax=Rhodobacter capsulatus TaxID=1061 RepID=UPI004025C92D
MPDLDVQDDGQSFPPSLSLTSVTVGQTVTIFYRLSNWTADFAPASLTGIYRSTNSTISTSDFGLGFNSSGSLSGVAGRSESFTFSTAGWAPGTYYIGAIADFSGAISESNESNNASSGIRLTVSSPTTRPW